MTNEQAAQYIGIKPQTLAAWRCQRREGQPPYRKIGSKVFYVREQLDAWLERQTVGAVG
jgi:hypothetical protein